MTSRTGDLTLIELNISFRKALEKYDDLEKAEAAVEHILKRIEENDPRPRLDKTTLTYGYSQYGLYLSLEEFNYVLSIINPEP